MDTPQARFRDEIHALPSAERETTIRARGREAEQRARRAETLVRINQLSLAAARGKVDAAIEWIGALLSSDEKLVVFCRHREIADALRAAYPASALATGQLTPPRRAGEIARFQDDEACRLIVCSLDAAGVGVTLTAASNVAFVEMAWTPAVQDQAEDRLHRIGQLSAVTAWYLLAVDTIDERIAAVVQDKRRLVSAASDGAVAAADGVLDELTAWLQRDPGVAGE